MPAASNARDAARTRPDATDFLWAWQNGDSTPTDLIVSKSRFQKARPSRRFVAQGVSGARVRRSLRRARAQRVGSPARKSSAARKATSSASVCASKWDCPVRRAAASARATSLSIVPCAVDHGSVRTAL